MGFVEIEYVERRGDWSMSELQSHDYYELYFLTEGEREFFFENRMYNVTERTLCVIPPFYMHKTAGGKYKRININVSPTLLTDGERDFLNSLADRAVFSIDEKRSRLIYELLAEGSNLLLIDEHEKKRVSLSIVHTVLYLLGKKALSSYENFAESINDEKDTRILEIVSYINSNYREEITLNEICERYFISKNTLCSAFRASMNCSLIEYLTFVRLNKAKELLASSARSISEIAELTGFSSANYFSLIFKKNVGISPRNYRKTK